MSELCKRRHDQLQEYSDQIQSAGKLKGDLDKLSAQVLGRCNQFSIQWNLQYKGHPVRGQTSQNSLITSTVAGQRFHCNAIVSDNCSAF